MSVLANLKTVTLSLLFLTITHCSTLPIELQNLPRHGLSPAQMINQIEAQTPHLMRYITNNSENVALITLVHTIATSSVPVVVKFYSNYCSPCRTMAPIVEKVAQEYEHKLLVVEVDTSTFREMTSIFNFHFIPTLLFFNNGIEVDKSNSLSEQQLQQKIKALV